MLSFLCAMGFVGLCFSFMLLALALSVGHYVWPEVDGGFVAQGLLQAPCLVGSCLPDSFQVWNLMDVRSSFTMRLMNSSWSGPAESNVYQKGDSMYLQVSTSSVGPDQELYIQSCYITSSDHMDKSRSALIFNKGCVSSKQSVIEFVSRQRDSINLLFNTSVVKFSQIYLHCSVVVSSALTPDTKSCNYNKTTSSWVELNGQTSVCECCASKCKGPPFYGSPSNELKALVTTGPFFIKEAQLEEQSLSNSFSTTSQLGFSTDTIGVAPGTLSASMKRGPIVASAIVSGNLKVPYSSPWLSQPAVSDSVMAMSQDPRSALSLLLPGLVVDIASSPVLEMVIDIPQQTNTAKLVSVSSHGVPTAKLNQTTSEEMHQEAHDWKSPVPDGVREYLADSPGLNDWNLGSDDPLKGLLSMEEELRGDVFMNDKWLQHDDPSGKKKHKEALTSMLEKPHEEKSGEIMVLEQTERVVKLKGDELGKLEYVKKTKLAFSQASDGSSSLSYEEERSPTKGEQEVEKREMEWSKVEEEGSSKKLEKALLQSLLDLLRGLNKTRTDQ